VGGRQDLPKIHRLFFATIIGAHWSDKVGLDLHQPENLRTLLFQVRLIANDVVSLGFLDNITTSIKT